MTPPGPLIPPKPEPRADRVSLATYLKLFRKDLLSAQPARLYRAWMAEFRTPFFRSFMINQPDLVREVLRTRPEDFPKSDRLSEGLTPLLGQSIFVTNGETWARQRRIIDPAFEGGRLRDTFPAMAAAAEAAARRLAQEATQGPVEIEQVASHAAADVIFRTLFSIPIDHAVAAEVFEAFRAYQRAQPLMNLGAFLPLPRWVPRGHSRATRNASKQIRQLIGDLTAARRVDIDAGRAPDDLATKIMTTRDPETGDLFSTEEMVDQVAIFFLAGHETSASALSWALYLLAMAPEHQTRVAEEARLHLVDPPDLAQAKALTFGRDVFREALRLYPPVPMMVRTAQHREQFRDRVVPRGSQIVISPWHLHRQTRLWDQPDAFDPDRWTTTNGQACAKSAFIPFSAGRRICPGAGFAMIEGALLMARLVRDFSFAPVAGKVPVPVAHLTVRARDGIWLNVTPREDAG